MTVWAVAMVKDEADVIERVIRHVAAQGVDGIIVADNGSTDLTRDLLVWMQGSGSLPCELSIIDDPEVGYWQSRKMTALGDQAHDRGAEWVWPFDADEWWQHDQGQLTIAQLCAQSPDWVVEARLYHHYVTGVDEPGHPFDSMRYRSAEPSSLPKVIVRWRPGCVLHAGNHGVDHPLGDGGAKAWLGVEARHFPYRSVEQFVSKAINGSEAYAATDLPWGTGQHWREYGVIYQREGRAGLERIYREHFVHDLPSASGLVYDPVHRP